MTNPQLRSVILADQDQRVPWPGRNGAFLPQDGAFEVSILDPFMAALLGDKTLIAAPPAAAKPDGKSKT